MDKVTRNIMLGTIVVLGGLTCIPQRTLCFPMGGTDKRIKADLRSLETVIQSETGALPKSLQQLMETDPPFVDRVPFDPWGNPYFFATVADCDLVTLATWGRDAMPGGVGDDADTVRVFVPHGKSIGPTSRSLPR